MSGLSPEPAHNAFAGHLGQLTPEQEAALVTFKDNLSRANLYTASTGNDLQASHDDVTLLRFLRARNFQPLPAQKQFSDAEAWRKQHDVFELYNSFDVEDFERAKRFYPRWTGRRDKSGHPLYVYRLASLIPIQKELESVPPEHEYKRLIVLYELLTRFTLPLCSALPHPLENTPISSSTSIIDLEDVSLGTMWRLRNHLQRASRLATANYPETLDTIAVVNSPSFFPTVWGWIKGWFDEGTRNKIHILGKNPGPALLELIHPHDLPGRYGGELEWEYEDEPRLDDAAGELIGVMPKGPVILQHGKVAKASAIDKTSSSA